MSAASVPQRGPSFLSSLGAGLAGGFLGSMLFRSMGGGHLPYGGMGGGGIGILEILILAGLLFWLLRMFMSRTQTASISNSSDTGAAALMREAKPYGWSGSSMERSDLSNREDIELGHTPSIENEMAMDLFFKIQGAWASRDLTVVNSSIDTDVRVFLDQEISKLKGSRQINRLDNIAVRKVEVAESWQEGNRYYSTVHFLASLLDYTIKEDTQELIEGSKNTPVKFEEYWTFSKEIDSDNWKLSAIQQI
jgi:predicted lipid-binding transport protein (Tim44 family)